MRPLSSALPKAASALLWAASLAASLAVPAATPPAPDFHADVAPILRDYCAACHSGKDIEGEFNLETYAALSKGGESGSPLPSKPGGESLLQKVLRGEKPAMPPKKEPQPTQADLAVLQAWLKAGAPGPIGSDPSILTLVTVPELPLKTRPSKAVTAAASSPDGRLLALARYKTVEVQDAKTHAVLHRFEGLPGKITSLQFSRNGERLAAASGIAGISGSTRVWSLSARNPASQKELLLENEHRDLVYAAAWSPDGSIIATAGYDSKIVLWNTETGTPLRTLSGHNGAVFHVAFSPDGTLLASASGDQTVKIWRVSDGERLDTLKEPQGEQFAVEFTPDGNGIVAAGADRRIRLWALKSRDKAQINPMLESRFAHEATINTLRILPGGRQVVSASLDRSLKVWSLPALELQSVLPQQPDTLTALDPHDGAVLVSRMNGSIETVPVPQPSSTEEKSSGAMATLRAQTEEEQPPAKIAEIEPNNLPAQAQPIPIPAEVTGAIEKAGDVDVFRFDAKKGEALTFEVFAGREKSTLDSRLEVRDEAGNPIERVALQATRSSWLTFRGKDANTSGDFRVQNYAEMELNEFLYCNGEVVKLWMYPRGPDSGFLVYPGQSTRQTYFDTTPTAHPLGEPVYSVRPLPPGAQPAPNGLPVFRLNYENDDDSSRIGGRDSVLHFVAPADGHYHLRLTDTRGFGDPAAKYRVVCRRTRPDFSVTISAGSKPSVSPGSGREFQVKAVRTDGFEGEIIVELEDLPPGFSATSPIVIEAGQNFALGVIYATEKARPTPEVAARTKLRATATIQGHTVTHQSAGLGEIKVGPAPKVTVAVEQIGKGSGPAEQPVELSIKPGETITAKIRARRIDFKDRIELGKEDSGRNLPHGVYVDNIGLNGLLILEGETEREFALTAAKWVPEGRRLIFFRATGDGGQASPAVWLNVKK